jgi:hypothetical protein
MRLREFMPGAADLARRRSTSSFGAAHLVSRLRTALRLGRQVRLQRGLEHAQCKIPMMQTEF